MRSFVLTSLLLLGAASAAQAQGAGSDSHGGDAALTYHWVRSNTGPGQCGCFGLNGVGVSASYQFHPVLSGVAEVSGEYAGTGPYTGNSLTLISYMAGVRYWVPQNWQHGPHGFQPFAEALIGVAHAGGGIAGAGDAEHAFADRIGGGVDIPLAPRLSARGQVDYFGLQFDNAANGHQNNLLFGVGVAYRWSH